MPSGRRWEGPCPPQAPGSPGPGGGAGSVARAVFRVLLFAGSPSHTRRESPGLVWLVKRGS